MPIDWLMIVFKFVLFGLLLYKVISLVKSYVVPLLREDLSLEQKQQIELVEREKLLICTQHRLENQISSQKKTFAVLGKNAQMWQASLLAQKEENERLSRQVNAHLENKRKIQQQYLALAKDGEKVIPRACEQAVADLTKNFYGDEGAKELSSFIARLVSKTS